MRRLVLFCDESIEKGKYYSHFFGAAMVEEKRLAQINAILEAKLAELNIAKELKFQRITPSYQAKYQAVLIEFFRFIQAGDIKIRIMFRQNIHQAVLTPEQRMRNGYFLLYYQLIKHAFGWPYMPDEGPVMVLLNFDKFPHTKEDVDKFKRYLCRLTNQPEFASKGVKIYSRNIAEVDSSKHIILQCLDVIMGSVQCKLNDGHKEKVEPGSRFISKRAKAKEAVYKTIRQEIGKLYPGYQFNVGETTAYTGDSAASYYTSRWTAPYRHWKFIPSSVERNKSYTPKNR